MKGLVVYCFPFFNTGCECSSTCVGRSWQCGAGCGALGPGPGTWPPVHHTVYSSAGIGGQLPPNLPLSDTKVHLAILSWTMLACVLFFLWNNTNIITFTLTRDNISMQINHYSKQRHQMKICMQKLKNRPHSTSTVRLQPLDTNMESYHHPLHHSWEQKRK